MAVFSAAILPLSPMEPVLSSASATCSLVMPQLTVDDDPLPAVAACP